MGYRNQRDINNTVTSGAWTITNIAETATLDCDNVGFSGSGGLTHVVATLITQLGEMGVLSVN